MSGWTHDLRGAANLLRRRPLFTAATVGTLALGIAANTTIFALVSATLLKRPSYREPDRLVAVYEVGTKGQEMHASWPGFKDWEASGVFSSTGAWWSEVTSVLGGGRPALARVCAASAGYFPVFEVEPASGRLPRADEQRATVAVISDRYWRHALGGRPLGDARLEIEGKTFDVVGVMPPSFDEPRGTDVWVPLELFTEPEQQRYRSAHNFRVFARLAPGVGLDGANERLDALTRRMAKTGADAAEGDEYLPVGAHARTLQADESLPVREPLLLLLGAAAFVLLVASLNLASGFLARGLERQRELAVRVALGASRRKLLRQLVAESSLLALLGAGAGIALALSLGRTVVAGAPPLLAKVGLQIDGKVGVYTLVAAVIAMLLSGFLPALLVTGAPSTSLRGGRGDGISRGQRRTWSVLVAVQAGLALLLLAGAGLLLRSFAHVLAVEPGFQVEKVATLELAPPGGHYPDDAAVATLQKKLIDALAASPQVEAAGLTTELPLAGWDQGGQMKAEPSTYGSASYRLVTGGYFRALRIPLVTGRLFDDRDGLEAPHAALVDQAAAELFWKGESPIGKRISSEGMDEWGISAPGQAQPRQWATVVGVVGNVRNRDLETPPRPCVYFALTQRPSKDAVLVARSRSTAAALFPVLEHTLAVTASDVPADEPKPLTSSVAEAAAQKRFALVLLAVFAGLALLLAAVGVYGVVAYAVTKRTRELGVRLALGAAPGQARDLVLRGSLAPVLAGSALGAIAAIGLARALAHFLYEVKPWDPVSWIGATVVLLVTAAFASWLPARRVTRIDPQLALRSE